MLKKGIYKLPDICFLLTLNFENLTIVFFADPFPLPDHFLEGQVFQGVPDILEDKVFGIIIDHTDIIMVSVDVGRSVLVVGERDFCTSVLHRFYLDVSFLTRRSPADDVIA